MNGKIILVIAALSLGACASGTRYAVLRPDATLDGGDATTVSIKVPGGWYQSTAKSDRQEYVAGDNFSRISFAASSVVADAQACPALAQRAANAAAGELTRGRTVKVDFAAAERAPEIVDFTLTVPGSPPGPTDRVVLGRTVCRDGALATVSCSFGVEQRGAMGKVCEGVVGSMTLERTATMRGQQAKPASTEPAPQAPATTP